MMNQLSIAVALDFDKTFHPTSSTFFSLRIFLVYQEFIEVFFYSFSFQFFARHSAISNSKTSSCGKDIIYIFVETFSLAHSNSLALACARFFFVFHSTPRVMSRHVASLCCMFYCARIHLCHFCYCQCENNVQHYIYETSSTIV